MRLRLPRNGAIALRLIAASSLAWCREQQQPLLPQDEPIKTVSEWNLNFSSAAPHYFASAYGLLQQWSNTFFPNGHSIVPCEIPPLTKLYHGRLDDDVPASPEWVAFDIGMAWGIMGGSRHSHMLTYQTTRPIKCVYFDGESATLFGTGQLDSQMLHIWGNLTGPPRPDKGFQFLWEEYARAAGLCDWFRSEGLGGPGWGYEGVVRMNAGFEMIWCDFTSPSLRLISHLNVTAPLLPKADEAQEELNSDVDPSSYFPLPPVPTKTDKSLEPTNAPVPPWDSQFSREPFEGTKLWLWFLSGVDHYGSSADGPASGEVRVKPLSCGFLSYYNPIFTTQAEYRAQAEQKTLNLTSDGYWTGPSEDGSRSQALKSLTRRRRYHVLEGVTSSEAILMRRNSERVLRDSLSASAMCSGIDWSVMVADIVRLYSKPLEVLLNTLEDHTSIPKNNQTALKDWVASVRGQTHDLLLEYLEYPHAPASEAIWKSDSQLFNETYARCRYQYTRLLDPSEDFTLGPEESSLKWAVEETLGGICYVLIDVGLSVEGLWQSKFNEQSSILTSSETQSLVKVDRDFARWTHGIEELMAWLGWAGEWTRCEKKCDLDERCFIPMWPLTNMGNFPGGGRGPRPPHGRPGYGHPRDPFPYPPPYGGFPDFPRNRTGGGRGPGRGFGGQQDETYLWNPICVKASNITR